MNERTIIKLETGRGVGFGFVRANRGDELFVETSADEGSWLVGAVSLCAENAGPQ